MLLFRLAQQPVDPVSSSLVQYGAVGVLALVGLIASVALWRRITTINDQINVQERARADRLEAELLSLNKLISSELSGHLVRATEAMREVTDMLRHRDRDRGDR
ncbi:hypothetical protein [Nocardia brasiliensis]|uniref:hypothetical protein n=1 Tax=Nocardia brasiliensis TaxID=37326 RepID=UPI002456DEBA|nr:hypothetical protein [Nocardia brasiliensis]